MEETEFSLKVINDEKIILDLVNELFEDVRIILGKLKDLKRDLYGSLSLTHKGIPIKIFKFLKKDFCKEIKKEIKDFNPKPGEDKKMVEFFLKQKEDLIDKLRTSKEKTEIEIIEYNDLIKNLEDCNDFLELLTTLKEHLSKNNFLISINLMNKTRKIVNNLIKEKSDIEFPNYKRGGYQYAVSNMGRKYQYELKGQFISRILFRVAYNLFALFDCRKHPTDSEYGFVIHIEKHTQLDYRKEGKLIDATKIVKENGSELKMHSKVGLRELTILLREDFGVPGEDFWTEIENLMKNRRERKFKIYTNTHFRSKNEIRSVRMPERLGWQIDRVEFVEGNERIPVEFLIIEHMTPIIRN